MVISDEVPQNNATNVIETYFLKKHILYINLPSKENLKEGFNSNVISES